MATIKRQYSKDIRTTTTRLYNLVIGDVTYPQWTSVFAEGSIFEGDWSKGSIIKFLGPDENGAMAGMYSRVEENIPNQYISIQHLGTIDKDGKIDTESDTVKAWLPSFENYTFTQNGDTTTWLVDMDVEESYLDYFDEKWPLAQQKLKTLVEGEFKAEIEVILNANIEQTWNCFTNDEHIIHWNFASDDWHCPASKTDLKEGGIFVWTMASKDGEFSFDFSGKYDQINAQSHLKYILEDGRVVNVYFEKISDTSTKLKEVFDIEFLHAKELQTGGWQAILENFKKHVESH